MQGFNKYYPPDYDPTKHTSLNSYRGKHALGDRARKLDQGILITRFELPFNIWCSGCNNHIGMGVRYNAEKKKIGNYFSTPMFSFRCKCHLCDNWFTVETDPKNTRYVVTSGARQKDEEWDPAENGGFAVHDPSASAAAAADPLAALEKTTEAKNHMTKVQVPRIDALQDLSDHYNTDPYTLSTKVRKYFREDKKIEQKKVAEDNLVRGKYALPEDLLLIRDNEETRSEAKEEWMKSRKDFVTDDEARKRRFIAEFGPLRPSAASASSSLRDPPRRRTVASLPSTTNAAGVKTSLQARLLQNSARHHDSPLGRLKPPESKGRLGIVLKK